MRELAVVVQNANQNVSAKETIQAIYEAGFKNVFIQWYDEEDWKMSQQEQVNLCKKLGLHILFAHLGYQNINAIWKEGIEGDLLVERYKKNIYDCHANGIPMIVMHLTSKKVAPAYNEIGLNRIRKLVEYAKEWNMKIAFENTKIKGYLEYVMENIKDEHVGICFDVGHYHVHFHDVFHFELFKNRILAVHLHDNDQSGDLHLLPFDGTIHWKHVMHELEDCHYDGPITMEFSYRYQYLNMPLNAFYKEGYARGIQLAKMLN